MFLNKKSGALTHNSAMCHRSQFEQIDYILSNFL